MRIKKDLKTPLVAVIDCHATSCVVDVRKPYTARTHVNKRGLALALNHQKPLRYWDPELPPKALVAD